MKAYKKNFMIIMILSIFFAGNCKTQINRIGKYPDFITKNIDYYITRIGSVPEIDPKTYRLNISGLVDTPRSFTINELKDLEMIELPLTVECIGNAPKGSLISTAVWKGFKLYDLLVSLGLDKKATGVEYRAADGYYASHTIDQVKNNGIIGALYMNGVDIPPEQGFPLRILNPGYYGVKQPAWVVEIQVIDRPIKDYWEDRGWDCSPPMPIDSTIFFPRDGTIINVGKKLDIGGAAFGGRRVKKVEITIDQGKTWQDAEIVKSMDQDNVWVFWKTSLVFSKKGVYLINVRATDINGKSQIEKDPQRYDGTNDWPVLRVKAVK